MTSPNNQAEEATVTINVNDLRASKDAPKAFVPSKVVGTLEDASVLVRLMALQAYIADLTKATLEHSNRLISGDSSVIDLPPVPAALSGQFDAVSPVIQAAGSKKRKRAPADPNAPKRALTPYFLYMQHTRKLIADELGPDAKPKDVSDEGTRRWKAMDAVTRAIWKDKYAENYRNYKEVLDAYKTDKAKDGPKAEVDADPADQLMLDAGASEAESSISSEAESEEEESPSPVQSVKEKTPPRSTNKRTRRISENKAATKETPAKQTSPVKKSRGKKADPEPIVPESAAKPATETKRKSKKRKSEA
ncbi:hypothetical protein N7495_005085 [Penicillium taxi]|uniref:uncharacterized protein n=1 Tax=Penicillium taxi TaxID=168475 RepID=UPI0025459C92|nr:uncharacterized protein N7495_005085 [Penicillium taxi]KAJ5893394.1 hypothetical protein N7495_005085 [Penicillium taxi]